MRVDARGSHFLPIVTQDKWLPPDRVYQALHPENPTRGTLIRAWLKGPQKRSISNPAPKPLLKPGESLQERRQRPMFSVIRETTKGMGRTVNIHAALIHENYSGQIQPHGSFRPPEMLGASRRAQAFDVQINTSPEMYERTIESIQRIGIIGVLERLLESQRILDEVSYFGRNHSKRLNVRQHMGVVSRPLTVSSPWKVHEEKLRFTPVGDIKDGVVDIHLQNGKVARAKLTPNGFAFLKSLPEHELAREITSSTHDLSPQIEEQLVDFLNRGMVVNAAALSDREKRERPYINPRLAKAINLHESSARRVRKKQEQVRLLLQRSSYPGGQSRAQVISQKTTTYEDVLNLQKGRSELGNVYFALRSLNSGPNALQLSMYQNYQHTKLLQIANKARKLRFTLPGGVTNIHGMTQKVDTVDGVNAYRQTLIQERKIPSFPQVPKEVFASSEISQLISRILEYPAFKNRGVTKSVVLRVLGVREKQNKNGESIFSASRLSLARTLLVSQWKAEQARLRFVEVQPVLEANPNAAGHALDVAVKSVESRVKAAEAYTIIENKITRFVTQQQILQDAKGIKRHMSRVKVNSGPFLQWAIRATRGQNILGL